MSGVRLHATNPAFWSGQGATVTFVVELPQPFTLTKVGGRDRSKEPCRTCSEFDAYGRPAKIVTHARKAIHLRLDSNGDYTVAPAIHASLLTVPGLLGAPGSGAPLEVMGEVASPPPLVIGAVDRSKERIVQVPLNASETPAAAIRPAETKYEAEKRIWSPYVPIMDAHRERLDRKETKAKAQKRRIFTPTKGR